MKAITYTAGLFRDSVLVALGILLATVAFLPGLLGLPVHLVQLAMQNADKLTGIL